MNMMHSMSVAEAAGLEVDSLVASYQGNQVVHGISFDIKPGQFVTLLGPSGCGKSTTLRCVAGLHKIDGGRILIGGEQVAAGGLHVRPEHRNVNMVFQSYAVWPHMSVFDNVAYGLKRGNTDKAVIARRVNEMLELVGLQDYAKRGATGLSGGQQQRVALARAVATNPRVLLLDEPLSNLDSVLRTRMRAEILRIQRETGKTTLYVTHDCSEALAMSDKIIILDQGRIDQVGTPEELYDTPVNRFVARFLGPVNFVRARVQEVSNRELAAVAPDLDQAPVFRMNRQRGRAVAPGDEIDLVIRPERVLIDKPDEGDETNSFPARLVRSDFLGSHCEAVFESGGVELQCQVERKRLAGLKNGEARLRIDPDYLTWVPAEN